MRSSIARRIVAISALFFILAASPAWAVEKNLDGDGVALRGYDPVSYFEGDHPKMGLEAHSAEHDGARYLFANAESRDKFIADPDHFARQFGGYCAYGVRVGRKFDIDPDVYRIVDDKLYFQLNWGTQVIWLVNMEENIDVAHNLWPVIKPQSDAELAEAAEKAGKQSNN
jgi:YHS domain-containing protein